jgi:DNA-binding XRE family transcriptional regulator
MLTTRQFEHLFRWHNRGNRHMDVPHMTLATELIKKQKALGIPSILQMSKKIKVAYGSLYFLLQGKHQPNVRTAPKYAKFLGVSTEKVLSLAGPKKATKARKPTKAKARLKISKPKAAKAAKTMAASA